MKNIFTLLIFLITSILAYAQVGIGDNNPHQSSVLEISSTNQGILTPRMTEEKRNSILSPVKGLLIFQTDNIPDFYYYDGTNWIALGQDDDWTISGNIMYNANSGNVGIGNEAPSAKFHITGPPPLINEDFTNYTVNQSHSPDSDCPTDGWQSGTTVLTNTVTTAASGDYLYINSNPDYCTQQASIFVGSFTPKGFDINIKFDYGFMEEYGEFNVYLLENSVRFSTILVNDDQSSFGNFTFNQNISGLDPSKTYSLEFEYIDTYGHGASVDNVLVTEIAGSSSINGSTFRLQDGQESENYVLTSDVNGNGTWKPASNSRLFSGTKKEGENFIVNDFEEKTNTLILNQQTKIELLKSKISDLRELVNKLISENK